MLDLKLPLEWGRPPKLKFKNYNEFFEALGELSNPKYCSIHYEYNKKNGSYTDVYRVQFSIDTSLLILPMQKKITSHSRFNCNQVFAFLVDNKVYSHNKKTHKIVRDYQVILNWIKKIAPEYVEDFDKGYYETVNKPLPHEPKIKPEDIIIINEEFINQLQSRTFVKRDIPKVSSTKISKKKKQLRKVDYVRKTIRDSELGLMGELYVYQSEYNKLKDAENKGLIESVEEVLFWVSKIDDSAGYDIKSYDPVTGNDIYIEVKTTSGSAVTPFYISENELLFSEAHSNNYKLYRLYNFTKDSSKDIEYFEIEGDLRNHPSLEIIPKNYEVRIKSTI